MKHLSGVTAAIVVMGAITAVWAAESANKVGGGYIVYPNKQGTVIFSHLSHGEKGAGFKCDSCHPAIQMKKGVVKMADLYAGKACGQCHDGKTKAPQTEQVALAVSNCAGCHMPDKEITIATKGPGKVLFFHARHTGTAEGENAGYSCGSCHPKPFEAKAGAPIGMPAPHTKGGCAVCHDGKATSPSGKVAITAAGNCMTCHKPG